VYTQFQVNKGVFLSTLHCINSKGWELQPSLSADGKTLYFVSDQEENHGEKDTHCRKQGQRKLFIIALQLVQFECMHKALKLKPLLLLDNIFDKMDEQSIDQFIQLVMPMMFTAPIDR